MIGFKLSHIRVDQSEELASLYEELKRDLQLTSAGTEGFGDDALHATISGLSYISKKMGMLVVRLSHMLRNTAELIISRYGSIMYRWDKRIRQNLHRIDSIKFTERKASVVPKEVLDKRIEAAKKLYHILDNVEMVCEAPVKPGSDDWRTPEFMKAYDAMMSIGFDANRYDLVKKAASVYDEARFKSTLGNHGYSVEHLGEVIQAIQPLTAYAQSNHVKNLTKRFVEYSDKLVKYEQSLNHQEDMDSMEKEELLHAVQVKIARLWWLTHFIKASHVLVGDIVIDVLKMCKIAEQCITD